MSMAWTSRTMSALSTNDRALWDGLNPCSLASARIVGVRGLAVFVQGTGLLEDRLLDIDRRFGAQSERDCIAGTRIDLPG